MNFSVRVPKYQKTEGNLPLDWRTVMPITTMKTAIWTIATKDDSIAMRHEFEYLENRKWGGFSVEIDPVGRLFWCRHDDTGHHNMGWVSRSWAQSRHKKVHVRRRKLDTSKRE